MNTTITEISSDKVLVKVTGEMDTLASEQFKQDVTPLMDRKGLALELDLGELDYIASRGLRVILALAQSLTPTGGSLKVTSVSPGVREVFDLTGFSGIFLS